MTIEAASYIHQLDANYPEGGSTVREGDNHVRLLKAAIKATFANVTGPLLCTHTELNQLQGVTATLQSNVAGGIARLDASTKLPVSLFAADMAVDFGVAAGYKVYAGGVNGTTLLHDGANGFVKSSTGHLYLDSITAKQVLLRSNSITGIDVSETTNRIMYAGNVKLETQTAGVKVTGDCNITGNWYVNYSDDRLKTNKVPVANALALLKDWSVFTYQSNGIADPDVDKVCLGLSAQEMQAAHPSLVGLAAFDKAEDGTSISGNNYLTADYVRVVPLLVRAVQQLLAAQVQLTKKQNQLQAFLLRLESDNDTKATLLADVRSRL